MESISSTNWWVNLSKEEKIRIASKHMHYPLKTSHQASNYFFCCLEMNERNALYKEYSNK